MAEGMVKLYKGKLMYVPGVGWHVWTGIYWRYDKLGEVTQCVIKTLKNAMARADKLTAESMLAECDGRQDLAEDFKERAEVLRKEARSCQNASGVRGIKELAGTYPQFAVDAKQLNANPFLINLQNCTLNLLSEEARQSDPADRITAVCNASFDQQRMDSFDPEVDCPRWHKYLAEVLPDRDVRDCFQELVGSAMAGEQFSHDVPIWRGGGRNGKGVAESTIRHVFGPDYAHIAPTDLLISRPGAHTTSQTSLLGKRFVVVDEQDGNGKISEAMLKKASGGGDITARKIKHDDITFHQTWLLNIIANELPNITGQGAAIWERLLIIEFPVVFTREQQDTSLRFDLVKEADGIFMWLFAGWRRFQERGRKFDIPPQVREATQKYRRRCDFVERWIDTWCERGTGKEYYVKPAVLQDNYNNFANGIPGAKLMRKKEFNDLMRDKGFRYIRQLAVFEGLKIRDKAADPDASADEGGG
ncbi:DNA primase family protein [Mycobacterium avium]|uniref:DNA primase family protein n=1 Tax=Mycobacterium avium TaxID=1764 RepID=UPI001594BD8D|nr:phage/plasmid primase, P4 family [Mycobacterium avium]